MCPLFWLDLLQNSSPCPIRTGSSNATQKKNSSLVAHGFENSIHLLFSKHNFLRYVLLLLLLLLLFAYLFIYLFSLNENKSRKVIFLWRLNHDEIFLNTFYSLSLSPHTHTHTHKSTDTFVTVLAEYLIIIQRRIL